VICHLCHLFARVDKKIIIPATMEKVWWVVIHLTMLTLPAPSLMDQALLDELLFS